MELSDKIIWIYGLFVAYPQGEALPHCPFEEYRKLTFKERFKIVEELTDEEIDNIVKYHKDCLVSRLKS